jgi:hypothetical protein
MFGAIVAQTPTVPVRIVNQSGPSWVEIAGVVATFLAVLVALFGRQLYESRRRPKLALSPYPETYTTTVGMDSAPMNLKLHNERGKDTARDVEVFVTVESVPAKGAPGWTPASDINLNFDDPEADGPGRSTTTVPSGHSREVNFAVVQVLTDEHGRPTDQWGYLAVYPPRFAKNRVLFSGHKYTATLVVTGANFDAITYRGELAFSEEREAGVLLRSLRWSKPPALFDER